MYVRYLDIDVNNKTFTDFMREDICFNEGRSVVSVDGLGGYMQFNIDYAKLDKR